MIDRHRPATASRCSLVVVATTAAYAAALAWLLPTLPLLTSARFADLLVGAASGVGLVAGTWLWLGTVATAVAAAAPPTQRDPAAGVSRVALPAPVRRLVLLACGLAVTGSLTIGPTEATPGRPHEARASQSLADRSVVPSIVPAARDGIPASGTPRATTVREIVVAPGDNLWAIAERTLPPAPSDAEVTRRWHQIYDDNRGAIGPDPDLVRPALRLRVPAR